MVLHTTAEVGQALLDSLRTTVANIEFGPRGSFPLSDQLLSRYPGQPAIAIQSYIEHVFGFDRERKPGDIVWIINRDALAQRLRLRNNTVPGSPVPAQALSRPSTVPAPSAPPRGMVSLFKHQQGKWEYQHSVGSAKEIELLLQGPVEYAALDMEGFHEQDGRKCAALMQYQYAPDAALLIDCCLADGTAAASSFQPMHAINACLRLTKFVLIHDCHEDIRVLGTAFTFFLLTCQFIDTQLVNEYFTSNPFGSMNKYLELMGCELHGYKAAAKEQMSKDTRVWLGPRPLPAVMISYALDDVRLLYACAAALSNKCNDNLMHLLIASTKKRIARALDPLCDGQRAVRFCSHQNHIMVSAEMPCHLSTANLPSNGHDHHQHQLQSFCDLTELLKLLPDSFALSDDMRADIEKDACEFVLDEERRPYYWKLTDNKRHWLSSNPMHVIKEADLQSICKQLTFGPDNRAGLNQQLHRISAMRDTTHKIYSLTLRIGRFFLGNTYAIADLLHHPDHANDSILVLGIPGSGKTSLIREMARVLAECNNVCIVDTSNEICGDGRVPHSCVGHARRMMIPHNQDQHEVMVECLQNHTPAVMVIDEIGRPQEVKAAATIKQRGVRLIASAHGDFRSILGNSELNGLLGGKKQVTVGDELAKQRGGDKLQTERAGAPTFDIVIELDKGNYSQCRVIMGVDRAVDNALKQLPVKAQKRVRKPTASSLQQSQPHSSMEQEIMFEFVHV